MRKIAIILLCALAFGCSKAEPPQDVKPAADGAVVVPKPGGVAKPKPDEPAAIDVPMVYLETVLGALSHRDRLKLTTMQQAAQQFKALEGRYPKDIEDFKRAGFKPQTLDRNKKWKFDPETGKVSILKLGPKK